MGSALTQPAQAAEDEPFDALDELAEAESFDPEPFEPEPFEPEPFGSEPFVPELFVPEPSAPEPFDPEPFEPLVPESADDPDDESLPAVAAGASVLLPLSDLESEPPSLAPSLPDEPAPDVRESLR